MARDQTDVVEAAVNGARPKMATSVHVSSAVAKRINNGQRLSREKRLERLAEMKAKYPKVSKNPDKPLMDRERQFVLLIAHQNLAPAQAAYQLELKNPTIAAKNYLARPQVAKALEIERAKYMIASQMTRKKVIDGFLEAVDLARVAGDSIAMTAGWREIGKMCGFYEPVKHEVKISVDGQILVTKLQTMSDAELLKMAEEQLGNDATVVATQ